MIDLPFIHARIERLDQVIAGLTREEHRMRTPGRRAQPSIRAEVRPS
jgi:hypothetical protein